MKSYFYRTVILILAVIINACTSDDVNTIVDSPGVNTASISAEIHVSYTGSQAVTIEVMLREGTINSNTDINLISGDTLKASTVGDPSQLNFSDDLFNNLLEISNQVKTLQRGTRRVYDHIISGIWYYATTDAKYRDKEFTVSLLRNSQNDAPNSVVSLPPDFSISIDELTASNIVSRSGPVTVRWSPISPGYSMEITGFVNCSNGDTDEWPAVSLNSSAGSYVIPTENLTGYSGDCIITIGAETWTLGSTDPAFQITSFIQGHQYRTRAIATVE
ncbi:MAG: hypothetical protein LJE85_06930 [Gammaproteobacteria bacterium]|jgi:hypothetical protein|nr:hypothetical protein [Gammaproteobacteria bacterium]